MPDERHVLIDHVEILDPEETPAEVTPQDLLALLVAHFEDSLIRKEHELIALRRSLEDAERNAAEIQHTLQQELETANQVSRILERENQRLTAEIEALRDQTERQHNHQDTTWRIQELERENRRLIAEIEALRRQASLPSSSGADGTPASMAPQQGAGSAVSLLSSLDTDDTLLETLLTRDLNPLPAESPRTVSQARRFRKRTSAL
jgi:DNA repair exonuclease SbcCD ATPase subunit